MSVLLQCSTLSNNFVQTLIFIDTLDRHHRPDDFGRNQTPANELQVYTWMDATLKEITNLVKEVHPEARKKGMIFDFAICYQVIFLFSSL